MNKKILITAGVTTGTLAGAFFLAAGVLAFRIIKEDHPYL